MYTSLPIGTKDVILAICIILILGLAVFCCWTWWECVITISVVCISFFAGGMKQVKRLE
jgi:hypothetical protein